MTRRARQDERAAFAVLGALSVSHFLNDMIQSLMLALYPLFKSQFSLSFAQVGLITLAWQFTASLLQPVIGFAADKKPQPFSLALGMGSTLGGLLLLSQAASFPLLLTAAALIGVGSAVFHPESSRMARMASGGRHGLAQSIFQVGGNCGSAVGPLAAAFIVLPHGQASLLWFSAAAGAAIALLIFVGRWYADQHRLPRKAAPPPQTHLPRRAVARTLLILLALIFSKFFYLAGINTFLTFYLMQRFGFGPREAQLHLFIFLGAVAAGTLFGGPLGDKIGRKRVIWISILGVAPFSLALPHAGAALAAPLTVVIGFLIASAFPAMIVYAQELLPGRVGMVSGLFFGLAFGLASIGAAVLGRLADAWGIVAVYQLIAWLPLLGALAMFLPDLRSRRSVAPDALKQELGELQA